MEFEDILGDSLQEVKNKSFLIKGLKFVTTSFSKNVKNKKKIFYFYKIFIKFISVKFNQCIIFDVFYFLKSRIQNL